MRISRLTSFLTNISVLGSLATLVLLFASIGYVEAETCLAIKKDKLKIVEMKSCRKGRIPLSALVGPSSVGPTGPAGAQGPVGPQGASGTARGYGFVSSSGLLNTNQSSANVSARRIDIGIYCISAADIDPTTVMPVVTADWWDGSGTVHLAQVVTSNVGCNSNEWAVLTKNFISSSSVFDNSNLAFSFVLP